MINKLSPRLRRLSAGISVSAVARVRKEGIATAPIIYDIKIQRACPLAQLLHGRGGFQRLACAKAHQSVLGRACVPQL
jgi:hypothetical protein